MRHVGDSGFGLAALRDIDDCHQKALAIAEFDAASIRQHLDFAAVRLDVAPVAAGVIDVVEPLERLGMRDPFILRPNILQRHRRKSRTVVAVVTNRRIVDAEKFRRFAVEHPHRHRIVVEQQPK